MNESSTAHWTVVAKRRRRRRRVDGMQLQLAGLLSERHRELPHVCTSQGVVGFASTPGS